MEEKKNNIHTCSNPSKDIEDLMGSKEKLSLRKQNVPQNNNLNYQRKIKQRRFLEILIFSILVLLFCLLVWLKSR